MPNLFAVTSLLAGVGLYSITQMAKSDEETKTELVVCKSADLVEGITRSVQVGESKDNFIVVVIVAGEVFALSGKCPHFGANLAQGYLDGYTLYCPWHSAAFDIRTGEMLQGPAVSSLQRYPARVSAEGDVIVTVQHDRLEQLAASRVSGSMRGQDPNDKRTFVIVGGGAAGLVAAETLRKDGFTGRIVMLSKEPVLPYDRCLLSKNFRSDSAKFTIRPHSFFEDYDIEFRSDAQVININEAHKVVTTADGYHIAFDKLLVATGCSARVPEAFKSAVLRLKGISTIRSAHDYDRASKHVHATESVVIVGASFLGLEIATAIKRAYPSKKVTVIDTNDAPLAHVFGPAIAKQLIELQAANGVRIITGVEINKVKESDGHFTGLTISHPNEFRGAVKEEVHGRALILAAGSELHTEYLPPHLLSVDGSIRVNSHLQTTNPAIYAAGDVASYFSLFTESRVRVEHWTVAQNMGASAAHNMLDKGDHFVVAPFFWTNQFGNAQLAGFSKGADWHWTESTAELGSEKKTGRITYFYKGNRPIGAATMNSPGAIIRLKIALEKGLLPTKEELVSGRVKYADIAARVALAGRVKGSCECA